MGDLKIEAEVLEEWQHISNLVADFCCVPAAVIMRKHPDAMEVIAGSQQPCLPYIRNEKIPLANERCSGWVARTQQPLYIPNAFKDPQWAHSLSAEMGMIFYYGVPLILPDGSAFGTLCITHCEEKLISEAETKLIDRFARTIELMLSLLENQTAFYQQSITDDLTGIANRRHFLECFNKEFQRAKRHETVFCVAMIDLDHFKQVNDQFGHDEGDHVLVRFTQRFKKTIRTEDTLGRVGGEEFALIMPMTDLPEAKLLLERFRSLIEKSWLIENKKITFSAGLVKYDAEYECSANLLSEADKLLYRAKQQGRNQICC